MNARRCEGGETAERTYHRLTIAGPQCSRAAERGIERREVPPSSETFVFMAFARPNRAQPKHSRSPASRADEICGNILESLL